MTFDVAAESYDRFMGRLFAPLAGPFADFAGVEPGQRVLDVGCGPGALTAELVARLGGGPVAAVDPSAPFVGRREARHPGVDVATRRGGAAPLRRRRVRRRARPARRPLHGRPGGRASGDGARHSPAAASSRPASGTTAAAAAPLEPVLARRARARPDVDDESQLAGASEGHLAELFAGGRAGVTSRRRELTVERASDGFDDWWEPFTLGVGPAGGYVAGLDGDGRERLRSRLRATFPSGSFRLTAVAWTARGVHEGHSS